MHANRPTLIIMARAPRIGAGKQRLAASIGRVQAWRINRALQARTLRLARDPRWRSLLCVTPDRAVSLALPNVWPREVMRVPQGSGDLGERLARALSFGALAPGRRKDSGLAAIPSDSFRRPDPRSRGSASQRQNRASPILGAGGPPIAIIGTDAPYVSRAHIASAFRALRRHRFAIGPCPDGGFWILAARDGREAARAMRGVRWSTPHALDDVLGRLSAPPAELPMLRDVDTIEDWRELGLRPRR